jgi:hypothetical protein
MRRGCLTLIRVFMPLRGRATARNFPKFLDGLRSHIGSCSLEGLLLSRGKLRHARKNEAFFSPDPSRTFGLQ